MFNDIIRCIVIILLVIFLILFIIYMAAFCYLDIQRLKIRNNKEKNE